ncbi:MAG: hypothetical protein PHI18_02010 [bacterium]|nr:hypothetical protein [bacterium]
MSARFYWSATDTDGDVQTGLDIDLYRHSDNAKIGDFTEAGNGVYYIDHNVSEKVYLKVGGSKVTATDGMIFPADDVALAANLISTESGYGASLIGIHDTYGSYTGTTLEAILTELATYARLALTTNGNGAALIGIYDTGDYYSGSSVEAALAQIGALVKLLTGLTSTAVELNKLDGASANVTATNLNLLTAGTETTLHKHNANALAGNVFQGNAQEDMDVYLQVQETESYGVGDAILNVARTEACGKAYVKKWDANDVATLYEIMTALEVGDLNFAGSPIIGSVSGSGTVTNALKLLANYAISAAAATGFQRQTLWIAGGTASSADGNEAGDPTSTTLWHEKTATSFKKKRRFTFTQTPDMKYLRMRYQAKTSSGGTGAVSLYAASGISSQQLWDDITETVYTEHTINIGLQVNLPVTVPTECLVEVAMQGDGGHNLSVNEIVEIWVEK